MKNTLFVLVLTMSGCCSNLQKPYVEAMEDTYEAILLDVEKGYYKPDEMSWDTLNAWEQANKDARAALEVEDQ